MWRVWKTSLALSLGFLVTGARGQEAVWRAASGPPSTPAYPPPQGIPAPTNPRAIATIGTPSAVPAASSVTVPTWTAVPAYAPQAPRYPAPQAPVHPAAQAPVYPTAQAAVLDRPIPIAQTTPAAAPVYYPPVAAAPSTQSGAQVGAGYYYPQQGGQASLARPIATTPGQANPVAAASFSPVNGPIIRGQAPDPLAPTPDPAAAPGNYGRPDQTLPVPPRVIAQPITPPTLTAPGVAPAPVAPVIPGLPGPPTLFAANGGCATCVPHQFAGVDGDWGDGCKFGNRWFGTAEYLLWAMKGDHAPPLATTGTLMGLTDRNVGALGRSDTQILFGNSALGDSVTSGGRFSAGYWFSDDHCLGIEVGGFFLGPVRDKFHASSPGSPELAIPFFDVNPASTGEAIEGVAGMRNTGVLAGTLDIQHQTMLWGYDINLRSNWLCGCNGHVDLLVGYRQLGLDESLTLNESLLAVTNRTDPTTGAILIPAGTTINGTDKFSVSNRFYGAQVGIDGEWRFSNRWSLGGSFKFGMGPTQEVATIQGARVINPPGGPSITSVGNLFSQPSNIGRFTKDEFSVVPELGLTLGYQLTNHVRATVGYNFLYWSNVARASEQIDRSVNSNFLNNPQPGATTPNRPAPLFNSTDFWAQGVTFGLEVRY
jgi:Putative beta barrel porin-7 (BBP7)